MATQSGQLTLWDRIIAASGASVASALVVNPLDVVKTRMQAQSAAESYRPVASNALLEKFAIAGCAPACRNGGGGGGVPPLCVAGPQCSIYESTVDAFRKIVRREGAMALWRGTDVALLMAIPMVGVYLPLYDLMSERWAPAWWAPLAAGSAARTVAVLSTSPLELVRTRMQALLHHESPGVRQGGAAARGPAASLWAHVPEAVGRGVLGRVRSLWTGVGATMARDVPFSAIYWGSLEPIRRVLLPQNTPASQSEVLGANFVAGSLGGALAAAVTTPLDVVKTRTQLGDGARHMPVLGTLRAVAAEGGVRALFVGVGPRAVRAAPACAIVLAAYEVIKASRSHSNTVDNA